MIEELLNSREESFFDWDNQLNSLMSKIKDNSNLCLMISAPFGWGKSSFTNILINELKSDKKKGWLKIYLLEDVWKYELFESHEIISIVKRLF